MTESPSMRERMLAGELYIADDPELAAESAKARRLTHQLNSSDPTDAARHREILTKLLAAFGEGSEIHRSSAASRDDRQAGDAVQDRLLAARRVT